MIKKDRGAPARKRHQELKLEVLSYYSEGRECKCVRCGFNDIRALSIDHINGGGHLHRSKIRVSNFYQWLLDNHYPKGYQTLCMNCQFIKRFERSEHSMDDLEKHKKSGIW